MKNSLLNLRLPKLLGVAAALVCSGAFTSCSDDLLTGTPEWLGSSIYEELASRGNFTTMLKLVEHPAVNQKDVLSRTGSRTVFAANDDAWQRFFAKNATLPENDPWANATSFEKLTPSQVRVLYKSNVLKNAYLIGLLGNVEGTEKDVDGQAQLAKNQCLRHVSGAEVLDSVVVFYNDEDQTFHYPKVLDPEVHKTDFWGHLREKDTIRTLSGYDDMPMMVHLTPGFINYNGLTQTDMAVLTGNPSATTNNTIVNGAVVDDTEELYTFNVTCQNGYIHLLTEVAMPSSNMAQIIDTRDDMKIFRSLLDRFSFPYFDKEVSELYNNAMHGSRDIKDSIYVRRYFNNNNAGHSLTNTADDRTGVEKIEAGSMVLPFDPAWNQNLTVSGSNKYKDIPVMLVPTDDKLEAYRQRLFGDKYPTWDDVPDNMILPMIKECMRSSFLVATPSQISALKNSSSQELGLDASNITACYFGANGVIYAINKEISAPDYLSVYAPVLMNSTEHFSVLHNFITEDDDDAIKTLSAAFKAYLNNFPSKNNETGEVKGNFYTFLAPANDALKKIYDPATRLHETSSGAIAPIAYQYYYDKRYDIVRADIFRYNIDLQEETGEIQKDETLSTDIMQSEVSPDYNTQITRTGNLTTWIQSPSYKLMVDVLDNNIVTSVLNDDQKFYKTKCGSPLYYDRVNGFAGGYQLQFESPQYIAPEYCVETEGGESGNGNTFTMLKEVAMPTDVSPYSILNAKFNKFTEIIKGRTNPKAYLAINDMAGKDSKESKCTQDFALQMLSNYNYTIYAPTDKTISILQDPEQGVEKGGKKYILPTWKWIDVLTRVKSLAKSNPADTASISNAIDSIRFCMDNFITYHIQDNSVYLQGARINETYETSCLDRTLGKFKTVDILTEQGSDVISVTDETGKIHNIKLDQSIDGKKSTQMHNLMTRQCYFNSNKPTDARYVGNSAYVVIHGLTNDSQGPDYLELDYEKYLISVDYYHYLQALVEKYGQTL